MKVCVKIPSIKLRNQCCFSIMGLLDFDNLGTAGSRI